MTPEEFEQLFDAYATEVASMGQFAPTALELRARIAERVSQLEAQYADTKIALNMARHTIERLRQNWQDTIVLAAAAVEDARSFDP